MATAKLYQHSKTMILKLPWSKITFLVIHSFRSSNTTFLIKKVFMGLKNLYFFFFLTHSKVILMLLILRLPLKLFQKLLVKIQVINRWWKPSVKARGPLKSLTKRSFPPTEGRKKTGLDSGLKSRQQNSRGGYPADTVRIIKDQDLVETMGPCHSGWGSPEKRSTPILEPQRPLQFWSLQMWPTHPY